MIINQFLAGNTYNTNEGKSFVAKTIDDEAELITTEDGSFVRFDEVQIESKQDNPKITYKDVYQKLNKQKEDKPKSNINHNVIIHLGDCYYSTNDIKQTSKEFFEKDITNTLIGKICTGNISYEKLGNYEEVHFFAPRHKTLIHGYCCMGNNLIYEALVVILKKLQLKLNAKQNILFILNENITNIDKEFIKTIIKQYFENGETNETTNTKV